ncbi:hypothetical protein MCOR27_008341 [Pyricularia oryzae]|uniref:SCA7 domain-containing protein n=4 Tax=Pyricularia TaxID=48558 RepID=A0ABQ8N4U8_PYRGI|nr:uncharacterized protein MGG_04661 [Pyricularia oryzae 70-15]ELQ34677.1 hypothetical protein OOU_Y34scaffold00749g12 [Pyricularia oryzae Y34]KAH8837415.1 hypothetical protein MCOR01_011037 [Pyricularia oryzae]KAI6291314.1 hypothetical protein MCOR33_010703 [Pyricularia grisea]EHA53849.1 hypothetical protein MGG_04661 [Pyricularia oryzae 70-15]KAI6255317.1 hypothetical protein MCOR19_008183 [Pyricularia oryzae]
MPDAASRKGLTASPSQNNVSANKKAAKATGEEATIKVASKKEPRTPANGPAKLKRAIPKLNGIGNWRDATIVNVEKKKSKAKEASAKARNKSPGPVVNPTEENSHETFETSSPALDSPGLQQCKHCKKSMSVARSPAHIAICLKVKKEKAQRKKEAREARERAKEAAAREEEARKAEEEGGGDDSSDDDDDEKGAGGGPGGKTTKKAAGKKTAGDDSKGKKRKADGDPDGKGGPKAKKKKDEPKPKTAKPKGPVDVERQCGVLTPTGQPCARSLTCKTHSMGAKRAVPGRSLPYDMLLAAYQKKNQAKQQKAALDANAPLEDDDEANAGPIDSDEETNLVMSALAKWRPQPVVPQPIHISIKRQYQLARLNEQLHTATNGGRTNIFKVNGFGAQRLPEGHPGLMDSEDAPGEEDPVLFGGRAGSIGGDASRRSSTFSMSMPQAHAHTAPRQNSVVAGRA